MRDCPFSVQCSTGVVVGWFCLGRIAFILASSAILLVKASPGFGSRLEIGVGIHLFVERMLDRGAASL